MGNPIYLGVNIDHVAMIRQARGVSYPDPIEAAFEAIHGGADNITLHLREDRRHIQDQDVHALRACLTVPMNFEMAITDEMLDFAEAIKPAQVCLVPEKRAELTTEGGLAVDRQHRAVAAAVARLTAAGCRVSLFIDPDKAQIDATCAAGAPEIEIHTGHYADAQTPEAQQRALEAIRSAADYALKKGLTVHAGHGLHQDNVSAIAAIEGIHTLNIGHALVAQAVFCGFREAVKHMRVLMDRARVGEHA